ncbi:hypothetical protein C8Q74DRAFT_25830 [Fomes fomentarius]|nr:hypothetical protein C8Q74DRAFT_25830 [Fomes fomentarius]
MLSVTCKGVKSVAACTLRCRARLPQDIARCTLSTTSTPLNSQASASLPWFVDPSESEPSALSPYTRRAGLPQAPTKPLPPLPSELPPDHPIVRLHADLKASPHLEPGTLLVRAPIPTAVGPPLPESMPRGRRRRGRTYVGEGVSENMGGIWEWLVIAQVKEGTENRGAIESVIRVVRKALLTANPPVPLPRTTNDG